MRRVAAQQPSTPNGEKARRCTIAEHRAWRRANLAEMASLRAYLHGHRARARRLLARANRIQRTQQFPNSRCCRKAFAAIAKG
jgi:hypothetical protein